MAFSEIYVDPSIAADSGTGTIGDPFGDLEYAIEQTTFDTTNGTRVNIKAGTDELTAAKIETAMADTVTTAAWAPSEMAWAVFQGYTAVAGDGGIGSVNCGGTHGFFQDQAADFVQVKDMVVHNVGANDAVSLDETCSIVNVEVHNGTGTTNYAIYVDSGHIQECYVHNWEGYAIRGDNAVVRFNYVWDDGATTALGIQAVPGYIVEHNIINFSETHGGNGIQTASLNSGVISNNSIYANAGTGNGIIITNGGVRDEVSNNLIEGFSGVGGIAISLDANSTGAKFVRGNSMYNNTTNIVYPDAGPIVDDDNETLTASPFNSASTGDFSPVDTGNVKEGSLPNVIGLA